MAGDATAAKQQNIISSGLVYSYYSSASKSFLHRLEILCTEVCIAGSGKYHSKKEYVLHTSFSVELLQKQYQRFLQQEEYPVLCT